MADGAEKPCRVRAKRVARQPAEQCFELLQPFVARSEDAAWTIYPSPLARSHIIYHRAREAEARVVERVVDCAVLRVTHQLKPSCVPFIRVEWRGVSSSPAIGRLSHWMPLWCFHPLAIQSLKSPMPIIPGNHSTVMVWLLDTVARTCARCRDGCCCDDHALGTPSGGLQSLCMASSADPRIAPLPHFSSVAAMTFVRPAPGWEQRAPAGYLTLAFRVPTNSRGSAANYGGAAVYDGSVKMSFGCGPAQRYLREVFDALCVRDLSAEEARDAFFAGPEEKSLSNIPPPSWTKGLVTKRKRVSASASARSELSGGDGEEEEEGAEGISASGDFAFRSSASDANVDECTHCGHNGDLICCDGCPNAYHAGCLRYLGRLVPSDDEEDGVQWLCPQCSGGGGGDASVGRGGSGRGYPDSRDGAVKQLPATTSSITTTAGQSARVTAAEQREAAAQQRVAALSSRLASSDAEHRERISALETKLDECLERARRAEAALAQTLMAQQHLQYQAQQHQQYQYQAQQQQQQPHSVYPPPGVYPPQYLPQYAPHQYAPPQMAAYFAAPGPLPSQLPPPSHSRSTAVAPPPEMLAPHYHLPAPLAQQQQSGPHYLTAPPMAPPLQLWQQQ